MKNQVIEVESNDKIKIKIQVTTIKYANLEDEVCFIKTYGKLNNMKCKQLVRDVNGIFISKENTYKITEVKTSEIASFIGE